MSEPYYFWFDAYTDARVPSQNKSRRGRGGTALVQAPPVLALERLAHEAAVLHERCALPAEWGFCPNRACRCWLTQGDPCSEYEDDGHPFKRCARCGHLPSAHGPRTVEVIPQ